MWKYNPIAVLIIVNSFFVFYGCNNEPLKTVNTADTIAIDNLNFDSILNCYDYTCQDHYFFTADYGCIYDPQGKNKFGNLSVFLIPHKSIDSSACNSVAEKISRLNISEIKRDFNVYVYLIPASDLHYNATGDPVYYQKENYTEKLYNFDSALKKWYLVDTITVNRDTENEKVQKWREDFIQSKIKK